MKIKIFASVVLILVSCNTSKLYSKRLAKIEQRHPEKIAAICVKNYPCTTTKSDTIFDYKDSVVFVDCDSVVKHDSLIEYVPVKVPVHLPIQIKTITAYKEDSAKIFLLQKEIKDLHQALIKTDLRHDNDGAIISSQRKKLWRWRVLAIVILIVLGIYTVYRIKK